MQTTQTTLIDLEINEALTELEKRWRTLKLAADWGESDEDAKARIEMAIQDYLDKLGSVEKAIKGTTKKKVAYATKQLADNPDGAIAALVRASVRRESVVSPSQIMKMAKTFSIWKPLKEKVRVVWVSKGEGKYRPIAAYGPFRSAQCLMLRDILMIAGISSNTNFARKGAGGEKALVGQICKCIKEDGKEWWWTPDIKQAFPSIRRGHFKWLGLDRRLLLNVAYLGTCAKIEMELPDDEKEFASFVQVTYSDLSGDTISDSAKLVIQRGLIQGSVLSPLLAGGLIAHVLSEIVSSHDSVMLAWHDDLHFGAETKAATIKLKEHVTSAMASLSAGSIELHDAHVVSATSGQLIVLGYVLQPGRGHIYFEDGSRSIHIKPGKKRTGRFRKRHFEKLSKCKTFAERQDVSRNYGQSWFLSQTAWTKVPEHSASNCCTIRTLQLAEFEINYSVNAQPKTCGSKSMINGW